MKQFIKNLIIKLSGNARIQRFLDWNAVRSQYLMGIGSGSSPDSSGEQVLVEKLKQQYAETSLPLCIFDVGANRGQFLVQIESGLQDIAFHIHAFEPSKHTYNLLCDNVKAYSNVTLNNLGFGKQAGDFELFYNQAGSGLASLYKRRLNHLGIYFDYSEKVKIDTLDNYCIGHRVQSIDLLKLDVEGHEFDVLQGGIQMFNQRRVKIVSFEFGGCNIDSRTYFKDFYIFFKEMGMEKMFRITPSGYLDPIYQYKEVYEQYRTTNFVVM